VRACVRAGGRAGGHVVGSLAVSSLSYIAACS